MASGETSDVYATHLVRQRVRVGGKKGRQRSLVRSARRDRRGKGGDREDGGTFRVGIGAADDASGTLNKANNAFASLAGLKSSLPSARTEPPRAEPSAEKTTTKSGGDAPDGANQLRLPVRVSSSRAGRRGKTVTVVRGAFPRDADARKALLRALKSTLGVGGALGVHDDTAEIVLQGDVVDLVVDALRARGHVDVKRAG